MSTALTHVEIVPVKDLKVDDVVYVSLSATEGNRFTDRIDDIPSSHPYPVQAVEEYHTLDETGHYLIKTNAGAFMIFADHKVLRRVL